MYLFNELQSREVRKGKRGKKNHKLSRQSRNQNKKFLAEHAKAAKVLYDIPIFKCIFSFANLASFARKNDSWVYLRKKRRCC